MKRNGRRDDDEGSSSSGSEEIGSERDVSDQQMALAALEAHFAQNFDLPVMKTEQGNSIKGKGKRKQRDIARASIGQTPISGTAPRNVGISVPSARANAVQTVVFGNPTTSSSSAETSNGWRKFMSSKVATKSDEEKKADLLATKKGSKPKRIEKEDEDDEEDEKKAQTNDRALSDLLSTTLFAPGGVGSTTKRSNGRPILGSNDTLARLLELSQPSMTGKVESQGRGYGAALLKSQEMGKMPLEIRHGMRRAELENQDKQLQRQKELGNYHHSIKGLVTKREGLDLVLGTKSKDRAKRTRDKGLSMGVGKFSGGMLKLSEQDIQRINKPSTSHSHKRRK
jgi:hypothetical protein